MNCKKFAELCELELDDFISDMFTGTGYAINGTRQTTIAYDTYGRIATMRMAEGI